MTVSYNYAIYLGAIVQWGFLFAFLHALANSINKPDKELVYISLVMCICYSGSLFTDYGQTTYLDFILLDACTLLALLFLKRFKFKSYPVAYYYVTAGLCINIIFSFLMHLDMTFSKYYEYWWFWSVFTAVVGSVNICMITVCFINRDFLGLVKFKSWFFNRTL
ncbi:hypothetical protein [Pseudoalteromonas agarivorans]|uniref:Uncharacterized protein n=1 Tax=Pseudoalteromonas agarivorans TaxID=176102 RepID=A0AAD0XBG7_9GAMM|nr:hypothetical protein [Pseudoalteromonas agarivorans]AYM85902.1 hypothetical protein D9T18_03905 [Pseudoalteromonas agarivorans]|tara:strand:+ start:732 stop:1223 length:492 start_codon:yes stop_codon:yes gene_type:complete